MLVELFHVFDLTQFMRDTWSLALSKAADLQLRLRHSKLTADDVALKPNLHMSFPANKNDNINTSCWIGPVGCLTLQVQYPNTGVHYWESAEPRNYLATALAKLRNCPVVRTDTSGGYVFLLRDEPPPALFVTQLPSDEGSQPG